MIVKKYKKLGYRAEVEVNGKTHYFAGFTIAEAQTKAQAFVASTTEITAGASPKQVLKIVKELGAVA